MRVYRGNVVRINARACFALLRAKRVCTGIWRKNTFQLVESLFFFFFIGSQNSNNNISCGRKEARSFCAYVIFIPVIISRLINSNSFLLVARQWIRRRQRIVTILTQYPRCNPTSVSWASPVGDDELHTRENKTKWNGGGRWADITQSNTRNQTVLRPRCLESNTRRSTVLYALCYDVSNVVIQPVSKQSTRFQTVQLFV